MATTRLIIRASSLDGLTDARCSLLVLRYRYCSIRYNPTVTTETAAESSLGYTSACAGTLGGDIAL